MILERVFSYSGVVIDHTIDAGDCVEKKKPFNIVYAINGRTVAEEDYWACSLQVYDPKFTMVTELKPFEPISAEPASIWTSDWE